jgi:hypothetical protein
MSQAFNLSQLANKVNTSGQLDVSTGVTGTLPNSNLPVVDIAHGGTNNGSLAVTAGGALYTDGTKVVNVGAGTSGQLLQSNGASAPSWATVSTESRTLLGTITASGNSVSLTGLNLTPYYALYIVINGVSTNSNTLQGFLSYNNSQSGANVVYVNNTSLFNWRYAILDLQTGSTVFPWNPATSTITSFSSTTPNASGGNTGITNSSTAIYFRMEGSSVFDAGTFIIYGMK